MTRRTYWTIDCETDPFRAGRLPEPFVWGAFHPESGEFLSWWGEDEGFADWAQNQDAILYAHNGGRFDFVFLRHLLNPGQKLQLIGSRIVAAKIGKAELRDSFSLLPFALGRYKKDPFDYCRMEREHREQNRAAILRYLEGDCVYLAELLEAFFSEHGRYPLTLASAAVKALQRVQGTKMPKATERWDAFFRPWYFGGRCQAFETGSWSRCRFPIYDLNSAYPWAMKTIHHGWGQEYDHRYTLPRGERKLGASFVVFEGLSRGALPVRTGGSLEYPDRWGTYYATGHELIAGLETQTINVDRILAVLTPRTTLTFGEYVSHYWKMKELAEKAGDDAGRMVAKLTLNSLYGKFAQNGREHRLVYVEEEIPENHPYPAYELPGGLWAVEYPNEVPRFYNVATAASITGAVRARLWTSICASRRPLYCDTDSIICRQGPETGTGIGEWKREGIAYELHLAGRKLYAARVGASTWKVASKGARLTPEEIQTICQGGEVVWTNDAPTLGALSNLSEPRFIQRRIRKRDQ